MARFNKFEIRSSRSHFELVKWSENNSFNNHCFTIGLLKWNDKERTFNFESIGLRYFQHREEGLEQWILAWCEMKKIEFEHKEDE